MSNNFTVDSGRLKTFAPAALVLDMDGLMVDSEPLWFEVERAFAADRGAVWTLAHAHAAVGRGLATTLLMMNEAFGFPVDIARDTALIQDAFVDRVGELALKPGCLELIAAATAASIPQAVASSSPLRLIHAVLDRFAITARFRRSSRASRSRTPSRPPTSSCALRPCSASLPRAAPSWRTRSRA
ncbi:MAG: HAD family phosphatase [Byssovorax sp.]